MSLKTDQALHRLERKAIQEAEKRKKPGECLKVRQKEIRFEWSHNFLIWFFFSLANSNNWFIFQYIQAIIDEDLTNETIGSKIVSASNVGYNLTKSLIPRSIYWQRSVQQTLKGPNNEVSGFFQLFFPTIH